MMTEKNGIGSGKITDLPLPSKVIEKPKEKCVQEEHVGCIVAVVFLS
jgi:hypothetical protein